MPWVCEYCPVSRVAREGVQMLVLLKAWVKLAHEPSGWAISLRMTGKESMSWSSDMMITTLGLSAVAARAGR